MLFGRDAETAAIERLVADARAGRSGVLVLRGEAGIGKSALLEHAAERAHGMQVLRGVGIESESELAYAALQQLLRPVFHLVERLPPPQAAALSAALALSDETVDERFRVLPAVLGLLAEAADERPLLCVVDDAHWLDRASAEALVFAARRVVAEPLVLLFAARDDGEVSFSSADLPERRLPALEPRDARALVEEHVGAHVSSQAVEWVLANANGNPLALVELPAALTLDQLSGREPLVGRVAPATSVEHAYLDRVRQLPRPTRELLLVAAAEETGELRTIARAARELGLRPRELAPAEDDGLLDVGVDRVEFRHPLVRSAVYRGASPDARERAHRVLAAALSGAGEADRRAWHRAAAVRRPDDELAAELERTAERARARGGHAAAAAALERAAALSPERGDRGRRLLLAARAASMAGRDEQAADLAERAGVLVEEPLLHAELARIVGVGAVRRGRPADGYRLMLDAARRLAPSGDESAAELLADAAIAAGMSGEVDARLVYRLARALDATTLRRPWAAVVRIMVGIDAVFGGDVSTGTASIDASLDDADGSGDAIELLWAGLGAITIGRDVDASVVLARAAAVARRTGALGVLTLALALRAPQAFVRGRLEEAAVDASEAVRLGREIGATNLVPHPLAIGAAVAALRGHEDEARARAEEAIALGGTQGVGLAAATATWTLGLLDLVRGRDAEALERLNSLREARPGFGHPVVTILTIPDRIEAAVRAGRPDEARAELPVYERWARDTGAAWAESRLAGCRALLADGDDATRHFEDAVEGADDARPFELGRIQLLFGEHLVRSRRRADARGRLRAALATFEQLNAVLWADRAASELHAIGEATRKREPSTIERLTPHELQIARLVAKGKSNKEVAAELFLSPRTIEYHLRKVYAALGISSRAELARLELGATVQEHVVVAAR